MPEPLSNETRQRVLKQLAVGTPKTAIARQLGISRQSVYKISEKSRETLDTEESLAAEIERLEAIADTLNRDFNLAKNASERAKLASSIADVSSKLGNLITRHSNLSGGATQAFSISEPLPPFPMQSDNTPEGREAFRKRSSIDRLRQICYQAIDQKSRTLPIASHRHSLDVEDFLSTFAHDTTK